MRILFLIILNIVLFISSCKLNLDSPFDPQANSYLGYDTVKNLDDIEAVIGDGSEVYWYPNLVGTACLTAISYDFQIAGSEANFDDLYYLVEDHSDNILDLYDTTIELSSGDWYWRLRGRNTTGFYGKWSDAVYFSLSNFSDITPADGAETTDTTPFFSWNEIDGADHYEIQIAESKSDVHSSTIVIVDSNSYTPTAGMTNNTYHFWRVRAVDIGGSVSGWSLINTFNIRDFVIGDTGPGGGIIFYDDEADGVDDIVGTRYLESAPVSTEWISKVWGGSYTMVGGTGTELGTGKDNTDAIVLALGDTEPYEGLSDYAAKLCADLSFGGYSDWFLPSMDESYEMCINIKEIGSFTGTYYWTSSEYDSSHARHQRFDDTNHQGYYNKNGIYGTNRVRAIRAF